MNKESEDIKKQVLSKMEALCSRSEKCISEIREKLAALPVNEDQADEILASLQKDKFIDESRYAETFVRDKFKFNQWGRLKIRQVLHLKSISEENISSGLKQIDDENYFQLLLKLLKEKNNQIKDKNPYSRKGKLFRFAAQKGFESDLIYKAIHLIFT